MGENNTFSIVLSYLSSRDLFPDQFCGRWWWYVCRQTKCPQVIGPQCRPLWKAPPGMQSLPKDGFLQLRDVTVVLRDLNGVDTPFFRLLVVALFISERSNRIEKCIDSKTDSCLKMLEYEDEDKVLHKRSSEARM